MLNSFKELEVWRRSMELVKVIYKQTTQFPRDEQYGLVSQMRRSAVSIPSNIAEGYKRRGLGDYIRFLAIADGSAAELETQVLIAKDLYRHIDFKQAEDLLLETQKMLIVLIQKLGVRHT